MYADEFVRSVDDGVFVSCYIYSPFLVLLLSHNFAGLKANRTQKKYMDFIIAGTMIKATYFSDGANAMRATEMDGNGDSFVVYGYKIIPKYA